MRSIKIIGLGVVAVLALALGASAAVAAEFHDEGAAAYPDPLSASAVTNQVFEAGFGTITCTKLELENTKGAEKATEQAAIVKYSSCSVPLETVEEPITAHYTFLSNEKVMITSPVIFKLKGLLTCTIEVTSGQELPGVKYVNSGNDLNLEASVEKINTNISGGCGSSGATGVYKGTSQVASTGGGKLSFK